MQLESGSDPNVLAEVDATFKSVRTVLRPHDWKAPDGTHVGGHYRTIATTGALPAGIVAGGSLFSFRWTNPDRAALINRIRAWATIGTAFTTAQEISLDLVRVTNFVNADTGGTALTIGEAARKSRSQMSASQVADLRVAAAAVLGAGASSAEEGVPIAGDCFSGLLNAVGSMARAVVYDIEAGHEGPVVINRLEGFRIRNRVLFGAVGVVVMTFDIDWSEVPTSLLGA